MEEGQLRQNSLIDTTDCLEAVGVFKCWKNFFFVVILICVLLLQACFWIVDRGYYKESGGVNCQAVRGVVSEPAEEPVNVESEAAEVTTQTAEIAAAAKAAAGDANTVAEAKEVERVRIPSVKPTSRQLACAVQLLNFILVPLAVLYCLTMLFSLKVSLAGRLGGINHIARAFFWSLILLVLLLPWQVMFPGVTKGAMFMPGELLNGCRQGCTTGSIVCTVLYYLRFVGYWALILLVLILAQSRNARWARMILRRLEVV